MKFKELATYLDRLEKTASRLEITAILSELFKKADSTEIDKIVYLLLGILAPSYEGVVFNLAERMMIRVLAKSYGVEDGIIRKSYKKVGDLGEVASEFAKKATSNLGVNEVYAALYKTAVDSGENSQDRKIESMAKLLSELDPLSARFVARIPIGKLRLGFSDKTIIDALSVMESGDKSKKSEIESAFNIRPDIGYISKLVKEKGTSGLSKLVKPSVEAPVAPMLAARLKSPEEMISKMRLVSVEPKFDGLRILIHYRRENYPNKGNAPYIRTYSRNMNFIDNSVFPELTDSVRGIGKYIKANEVILDTEAVGMDPKRERLVDFQTTMQRRRKHNIEQSATDIPLQFQVFDILLKDGQSFLNKSYLDRREELQKTIKSGSLLRIDEYTITSDPDEIRKLHQKYLALGFEGIIVKKTDSSYVSGRTGWRWVKMKEAEGVEGKLADTIDAVIMGFTGGRGKRAGFGIGQFLAGVRDGEVYKSITKVGTGLSDEQFKELIKRLKKLKSKDRPKEYEVHKDLTPDFWVSPEVVVELAADEITKSPKHTAGLALRFPRLIKFRDDKSPREATTLAELRTLLKTGH